MLECWKIKSCSDAERTIRQERETMKKKAAYFGIFTSLALILSYIESLLPLFYGIPGIKPGLANSMTLVMLYLSDPPTALMLAVARILLSGLMFGNLFAILYSLAGGLFSFLIMFLVKKYAGFSMLGVSMAGGVSHNIAQLVIAMLLIENLNLLYYLPVLLVSGLLTGTLIGIVSREVIRRLPSDIRRL